MFDGCLVSGWDIIKWYTVTSNKHWNIVILVVKTKNWLANKVIWEVMKKKNKIKTNRCCFKCHNWKLHLETSTVVVDKGRDRKVFKSLFDKEFAEGASKETSIILYRNSMQPGYKECIKIHALK